MRISAAVTLLLCANLARYAQAQTGQQKGVGAGSEGIDLAPTRFVLKAKAPTGLLSLRNGRSQASRFQVQAFAWTESAAGKMVLVPTEDIVFFPPLLTVQPGEIRKIRIGAAVPFAPVEKSYRLIIQELPPLESHDGEESGIHTLMKFNLPVFLQAARPASQAQLEDFVLKDGQLSFRVKNEGNSHLLLQSVSVTGSGKSGEAVFEHQLAGWYVLAGDVRNY